MIDVTALGRRLNQLRELRGLSLTALAGAAGVSKSYLAKLERGEVENPGLKTLQAIATALGSTLGELLADAGAFDAASSSALSEIGEYEVLLNSLPVALRQFIEQKDSSGERLPADVVRSLASIQFRGKRPETVADWDFLYQAIGRSMP